jgi:hypothetical protein
VVGRRRRHRVRPRGRRPDEQCLVIAEDPRIWFVLTRRVRAVIGFIVFEPHDIDAVALDARELPTAPQLDVPVLASVRRWPANRGRPGGCERSQETDAAMRSSGG